MLAPVQDLLPAARQRDTHHRRTHEGGTQERAQQPQHLEAHGSQRRGEQGGASVLAHLAERALPGRCGECGTRPPQRHHVESDRLPAQRSGGCFLVSDEGGDRGPDAAGTVGGLDEGVPNDHRDLCLDASTEVGPGTCGVDLLDLGLGVAQGTRASVTGT